MSRDLIQSRLQLKIVDVFDNEFHFKKPGTFRQNIENLQSRTTIVNVSNALSRIINILNNTYNSSPHEVCQRIMSFATALDLQTLKELLHIFDPKQELFERIQQEEETLAINQELYERMNRFIQQSEETQQAQDVIQQTGKLTDITEIRRDITEIRRDITEIRRDITEIRRDITEIRREIRRDITEIRREMRMRQEVNVQSATLGIINENVQNQGKD